MSEAQVKTPPKSVGFWATGVYGSAKMTNSKFYAIVIPMPERPTLLQRLVMLAQGWRWEDGPHEEPRTC